MGIFKMLYWLKKMRFEPDQNLKLSRCQLIREGYLCGDSVSIFMSGAEFGRQGGD